MDDTKLASAESEISVGFGIHISTFEKQRVLDEIGSEVVDHMPSTGLYTIRLDEKDYGELKDTVETLMAVPGVEFAFIETPDAAKSNT